MLYIRRSAPYYLIIFLAVRLFAASGSWCGLQDRFSLQLLFRGSGVFPDDWVMVLPAILSASPLLMIIFLLLYEEISVLVNFTGRSYVACSVRLSLLRMRCSTSVLGFYDPSVRYGTCSFVASSFSVLTYLLKYDWTLIQRVIYRSVAVRPGYRCCTMALGSHLLGFPPSSM